MPDTQQIIISIDERLAEARQEIASLEAALAAISGHPSPPSTKRPAKRTKRTAKRTKRPPPSAKPTSASSRPTASANGSTSEAPATGTPRTPRRQRSKAAKSRGLVAAQKLEALLGTYEGVTTTSLAERADGDRGLVLKLLRELEAAGRVRRTGERRGTRWHLVTEEDLIAERAAELERQSKRVRARKN